MRYTVSLSVLPEDFEAGRRLLVEYQQFIQDLIPQIAETVRRDFEIEFAAYPQQYLPPRGLLLLGWDGTSADGCVALRFLDHRRCELERLYVRPAVRRSGLGEALTRACIDAARASGRAQLILVTSPPLRSSDSAVSSTRFPGHPSRG